jgi:PKD repeat protein
MGRRTIALLGAAGLLLALTGTGSTAQSADEPGVVHFTAVGDFGGSGNTRAVLAGMAAQDPDLALALGDLSYGATGAEQAWCDMVTQQVGAGFPFQLIAGNHESNGQNGHINDFAACLPNQLQGLVGSYGRQWYVDVPRVDPLVRFIMVSPAIPFPDSTWSYAEGTPRYDWTVAAIDSARATGIPWVVVGAHKPCFSMGTYSCEIGADFTDMLIRKRVDLVLHGHEHFYQRTHQLGLRTGCATVAPGAYDADCVADRDGAMSQGLGTVFATSGLGGQEKRNVDPADTEAPYFAAASAGNQDPSYGFLDVEVTADDLVARFVPVGGATFTDAFSIHRGAQPPNTAPTARFTSTSNGLTAAFDGRGSDDAEGPVAAWSWDFGDGSATGAGAQPSHAYAAAGTYPVTLTVTDAPGATARITNSVSVTAPAPGPADVVLDTFGRTVSGGWGTAEVGGPWTTSGTAANFSVAGGSGAFVIPAAGTTRAVWLDGTRRTSTDLRLTLSLDKVPSGNGAYLDVVGRRINATNDYRARMVMSSTGRVTVQLTALRGTSTAVGLAPAVTLPTTVSYAAGTQVHVRLQVTGTNPTTIRLKVWSAGASEPTAWQTSATDTTAALQGAGAIGLSGYLSGSVTNAPVVLRLDDLGARPVE